MGLLSKIAGGIKKIIKGVGKLIKKGVRKVGGFFKRAFKGVGEFMGKLGPIGMLGMMLIMPQLGAWWSDFGAWAGKLTGPFKGLMNGFYEAGKWVGGKISSVTEGISEFIKGIPGVGDAYEGLETWMTEKMEAGREFFGLETKTGLEYKKAGLENQEIYDALPDDIKAIGDPASYKTEPVSSAQVLDPTDQYSLNPKGFEGLDISQFETTQDVVDFRNKMIENNMVITTQQDEFLEQIHGGLGGKEGSLLAKPSGDKWYTKAKNIYTGLASAKGILEETGIISGEEYGPTYGTYVADNYVPLYESAQVDWTQAGYAGTPQYGAGNPNYLQAIYSSFTEDPYFMWMAKNQPQTRKV